MAEWERGQWLRRPDGMELRFPVLEQAACRRCGTLYRHGDGSPLHPRDFLIGDSAVVPMPPPDGQPRRTLLPLRDTEAA